MIRYYWSLLFSFIVYSVCSITSDWKVFSWRDIGHPTHVTVGHFFAYHNDVDIYYKISACPRIGGLLRFGLAYLESPVSVRPTQKSAAESRTTRRSAFRTGTDSGLSVDARGGLVPRLLEKRRENRWSVCRSVFAFSRTERNVTENTRARTPVCLSLRFRCPGRGDSTLSGLDVSAPTTTSSWNLRSVFFFFFY